MKKTKDKQLSVRMTVKEYKEFSRMAKKLKFTRAAVARALILAELARHKNQQSIFKAEA